MEALIRVAGGDADELRELLRWLGDEQELRGRARLVHAPVGESDLGGVVDAVSVAVGAGGAGTVLASALITWLQTRRTAVRLLVRRGDHTVVLDLQTSETVLPLLERLLESPDEP
jgi:Effector Associated Constant Component 1